jgi:hypothetical protein
MLKQTYLLLLLLVIGYSIPSTKYLVGQWVITSVLDYPTNITMRYDADDIHFNYGSKAEHVLVFTLSGNNTIKFTPRPTARDANSLTNPTELEVENAFATAISYDFSDKDLDDLNLKDAFGRTLVTFEKADAHKARNKIRAQTQQKQLNQNSYYDDPYYDQSYGRNSRQPFRQPSRQNYRY